jgi:hypothetical protein
MLGSSVPYILDAPSTRVARISELQHMIVAYCERPALLALAFTAWAWVEPATDALWWYLADLSKLCAVSGDMVTRAGELVSAV